MISAENRTRALKSISKNIFLKSAADESQYICNEVENLNYGKRIRIFRT